MLKLKNDALRDDARWSSSVVHQKQSVSQCEATTASGVDNAAPRLADTAERDYFYPQREADHYANNWKELQKYINEQ